MAELSLFLSCTKNELSCPVCKEIFVDLKIPIVLDCPHTCCQSCVQRIAGARNVVECPECRKVTCIPQGGVEMMKTNIRLKNLAKMHNDFERNKEVAPPKCKRHVTERMHYYCATCNKTLCQVCHTLKHKDCDIKELKETYEEQLGELMTILGEVDNEARLCDKSAESLNKLKEDVKASLSAEQQKINQQEKLAIENIRKEAQAKRVELQQMEEPRLNDIQENTIRLRRHANGIRRKNQQLQKVLEDTSNHKYVIQHDEIVGSLKSMLDEDKAEGIDRQVDSTKFVFKSTPVVSLGKVVKYQKLVNVDEFGKFDHLVSITETTQGEIVLLDTENKNEQLHVYEKDDEGKYMLQKSVALASCTTNKPCGVAVRDDRKFLVACGSQIKVYSLQGSLECSVDMKRGKAHVIKMLTDGKVLVADIDNCTITILSQDLSEIQSFKTSLPPRCVAILPHPRIAISDFQSSQVLVIDLTSGDVIQTYKVSNALGLCYQEATDSLLVARNTKLLSDQSGPLYGHGEVLQYCCTTGVLVGNTVDVKLDCTWDMVILRDGRLAVADLWTAKIFA